MAGVLASTVLLALCPVVGNAFVIGAPQITSADSAWSRPDPAGFGAPIRVGRQRVGAGSAPSGIGGDDVEETEKRLARVSPLQRFKGLESDTFGGIADRRVLVGMGELASLTDLAAMQWSSVASHDSASTGEHDAGGNHDSSTHDASYNTDIPTDADRATDVNPEHRDVGQRPVTLEDAVDEAMRPMLHNALSGRAASFKPAVSQDAVGTVIESRLRDAFSGRAASQAVSYLHMGGSEVADAGGLRDTLTSKLETSSADDDSKLAYNDYLRGSADIEAEYEEATSWYTDWDTASGTPVVRKVRKGPRQWLKKSWRWIRRKGR